MCAAKLEMPFITNGSAALSSIERNPPSCKVVRFDARLAFDTIFLRLFLNFDIFRFLGPDNGITPFKIFKQTSLMALIKEPSAPAIIFLAAFGVALEISTRVCL